MGPTETNTGAGVPNDGELLAAFADDGSQPAFRALVARHARLVLGVCRRVAGGDRHGAEDAAQATFAELANQAGALRGRASVAGWLYRVAWHKAARARRDAIARDRYERQRFAAARSDGAGGAPAADAACLEAEARAELDRALALLPEPYREAVVLHHLEGLSVRQAAAVLGCPAGTVAARVSRARSMLRERLAWRGVSLPAGGGVFVGAVLAELGRDVAAGAGVGAGVTDSLTAYGLGFRV